MPHLPILKILGKDPIWLMWLTWCLLLGGEWAWGMIQPASTHEPPLGTGVGKYGGLGHDIGHFGAVKGSPMLIDGWYSSVPRQAKIGWENIVIAQLFLGSEPDRGRSPVEWGDFLFVRLFVHPSVSPSGPSSQAWGDTVSLDYGTNFRPFYGAGTRARMWIGRFFRSGFHNYIWIL